MARVGEQEMREYSVGELRIRMLVADDEAVDDNDDDDFAMPSW